MDYTALEADRASIAAAEQAPEGIREDEVLRLTMACADELSALLLQAIANIESHRPRLATQRNLWTPSRALAGTIQAIYMRRAPEISK